MKKMNPLAAIELLINSNRLAEAEKLISTINTDETTRLTLNGLIQFKKGKTHDAMLLLSRAVEKGPKNKLARGYLGTLMVNLKRFKEAEPYVDESLERSPEDHQFIINKALILNEYHKHEELVDFVKSKLHLSKNSILHTILVSALRSLYRLDEALLTLEEATNKYPDSKDLIKVRADLLSEIDPIKSVSAFDAIYSTMDPGKATKWNSSFVDLRARNWKRGFENYECGLDQDIGQIGRPLPEVIHLFERIKSKEEIDNRRWIILSGEQGIGDQVFFMSALNELLKITKKIILLIDQRMIPIAARSFPEISVMKFGVASLLGNRNDVQGYIPLGSLLGMFRSSTEDFILSKHHYLINNEKQTNKYREKIKEASNGKPIVGISWKGGFWERQQKGKTLELSHWDPLLSRKDMTFLCLQYGDTEKEQKYCREKGYDVKFIKGINFKNDLDSWFSLIACCDFIISISTAMVHFAAANSKKVYLLLGDKQQPFIWGLNETKSIVYNDVNIIRMSPKARISEYFKALSGVFK